MSYAMKQEEWGHENSLGKNEDIKKRREKSTKQKNKYYFSWEEKRKKEIWKKKKDVCKLFSKKEKKIFCVKKK